MKRPTSPPRRTFPAATGALDFEDVPFAAGDGLTLNLRRIKSPKRQAKSPVVMLVHGAGVRSNIFLPPNADTLPAMLGRLGFDVWLLDWRGSIETRPNPWTLDQAAVHDYPAAAAVIRRVTGASSMKAVIHCQGSTSFMMSIVAGLLPEVETVVSNAVALHTLVPPLARLKSIAATNTIGAMIDYVNPQWGLHVSGFWPRVIDAWVRATHHECRNPVCKHSSFTYGSGFPTLWLHENLSDETHEWLKGEFAHVPMSFFRQMKRCIAKGNLVSTGEFNELPADFCAQAPRTDARFVFLGGEKNACFTAAGMARTCDWFDRHAPGRHSFYKLAGYGHLDVFIGKNAHHDTLPLIADELMRS
jgi:pimeloyl-ACP methyl ester carboxylesterase